VSLHLRFLHHLQESDPVLLHAGHPFSEEELWSLTADGLLDAVADFYCDNGHNYFGNKPVTAPVEVKPVECSMCEEPSYEQDDHHVRYKFATKLGRRPAHSQKVQGLLAVREKAEAFRDAYPPDLFEPLTEAEWAAVPHRQRQGVWVRAIQHATKHILASEKETS
jgi:hypothetical protein